MTYQKLSLTLRSALIHECLIVANVYIKFKDWQMVRDEVLSNNLYKLEQNAPLKQYMVKYLSDS